MQRALQLALALVLAPVAAGETQLLDPQFNSIATCPCDLVSGACDIACCCDADCSDADKTLFDCQSGVYYGNDTSVNLRSCYSTSHLNPDYHQFTCVFIENFNAYLGLYFPITAALTTRSSVTSQSVSDAFQFSETAGAFALAEANDATQRRGLIILQQQSNVASYSGSSALLANTRLALPARTLAGACDTSAGVVFLADNSSASCDIVVTSDLCRAAVASPLDYQNYACNNCNRTVINRGTTQAVSVTINFRQLTSAVTYQKGLSGSQPTSADSTAASPIVIGSTCTNAVVEVQYLLRWNGTELTSATATYLVANVTVGSTLTQRFSAEFLHATSTNSVSRRSGVVGYNPGASLLFRRQGNSSLGTQPLLQPDSNGNCRTGAGDTVDFLVNSARHCRLQLQLGNFTDCSSLVSYTQNLLSSQFPANSVGVHGNANVSVNGDWATLISTLPESYNASGAVWETSAGFCASVPTDIIFTVLYAEQGKADDSSIWHVVGASLKYSVANLSFTCSLGSCGGTTAVTMTTRIRYIRVPPNWLTNPGASVGSYKADCWWGICWQELAYPLTDDFDAESKARTVAWTLLLILIVIFACCVSYPWW